MNPPETHKVDTPKAVVILLSGFLGAGKTTLLKNILSWEGDLSGTVVVVNEFGEVGIDGALLSDAGTDVVEMTSGCICCSLSADLIQSLQSVCERFSPRRIFIECTGVADPTAVVAVLKEPVLADKMVLKKVVTVLDADYWEARENFGPLFYHQLDAANLILLNKVDLIEAGRVPVMLKQIHETIADAQVVPTIRCRVDPATLWTEAAPKGFSLKPIQFFRPVGQEKSASSAPEGPVSAAAYVTFSYASDRVLNGERFRQFLAELPWEVFRVKGPVRLADGTRVLNFVGGKHDWLPWQGPQGNRLALIGWNIEPAVILSRLKACEE